TLTARRRCGGMGAVGAPTSKGQPTALPTRPGIARGSCAAGPAGPGRTSRAERGTVSWRSRVPSAGPAVDGRGPGGPAGGGPPGGGPAGGGPALGGPALGGPALGGLAG